MLSEQEARWTLQSANDTVKRFDVTYGMDYGWTEADMPSLSIRDWFTQRVTRGGTLELGNILESGIQL